MTMTRREFFSSAVAAITAAYLPSAGGMLLPRSPQLYTFKVNATGLNTTDARLLRAGLRRGGHLLVSLMFNAVGGLVEWVAPLEDEIVGEDVWPFLDGDAEAGAVIALGRRVHADRSSELVLRFDDHTERVFPW